MQQVVETARNGWTKKPIRNVPIRDAVLMREQCPVQALDGRRIGEIQADGAIRIRAEKGLQVRKRSGQRLEIIAVDMGVGGVYGWRVE